MSCDPALLELFHAESEAHMAVLTEGLLALERNPHDAGRYEALMRAAHSIKGAARIVGLDQAVALAHVIEDCFVAARAGKLTLGSETVDVLLPAVDLLQRVTQSADPAGAPSAAELQRVVGAVQEAIAGGGAPAGAPRASGDHLPAAALPPPTSPSAASPPSASSATTSSPAELSPSRASAAQNNEFLLEAREHLASVCDLLLNLEKSPPEEARERIDHLLRAVHSIKGGAGYLGHRTIQSVAHAFESVVEAAREGSPPTDARLVDALLAATDQLSALLDDLDHSNAWDVTGLMTRFDELLRSAATVPVAENRDAPRHVFAAAPTAPSPAALPPAAALRERAEPVAQPPATAVAQAPPNVAMSSVSVERSGTLRIPVGLVDRLMTLAGELVLARNQTRRYADQNQPLPPSVVQRLSSVTSEFQDVILQTRMQPVGQLFNRFPRLVRDLARQLGKEIELRMVGAEVELDKSILDAMVDPLTHLVRNACDHGIESPEVRERNGKPRQGTITLAARHLGDEIALDVSDDGGGIDRERVKLQALRQGLRTAEQLAHLDDRELLGLILLPGFSTASAVTDVSGRGVGMDVVKTRIEQQSGHLEISSTPGGGTAFHLRLPLTLAIIPCLLVRSGGSRYALPQKDIEELVYVHPGQTRVRLERTADREFARLRGDLLPLVRLEQVLSQPVPFTEAVRQELIAARAEKAEESLLFAVVRTGPHRLALAVEQIEASDEIVVKPMHGGLRNLAIYSGATILGDGTIALILHCDGIARHAQIRWGDDAKAGGRVKSSAGEPTQAVLLCRHAAAEPFAVQLGTVRRIVMLHRRQVEMIGGQPHVTIDGVVTRLWTLDQFLPSGPLADAPLQYALLPRTSSPPAALWVADILDTRSVGTRTQPSHLQGAGVIGHLVLDDRITTLLDLNQLLLGTARDPQPDDPRVAAPHARILLVEDTQFFRELVRGYLEADGYAVTTADHGQAGLEALERGAFDVIVSDLEMPVLDGWSFAAEVRRRYPGVRLPMLALTTLSGDVDRQRALEQGFDEFLVKVDRGQLAAAVGRLLQTSREPHPAEEVSHAGN